MKLLLYLLFYAVDFRNVVSNPFYAGFYLVEIQYIKRKNEAIGIAPKHNDHLRASHMQS